MRKIVFLLLIAVLVFALYAKRMEIQHRIFVAAANRAGAQALDGPLRVERAFLDRSFKLHLENLSFRLKTDTEPVPLSVASIVSEEPALKAFSKEGLKLKFEGLRPTGELEKSARGTLRVRAGRDWFFETVTQIERLDLGDIDWMDPDHLKGSSGLLSGTTRFYLDMSEHMEFKLEAEVPEPGGMLQAKLFSALLPYLPNLPNKARITALAQTAELVPYKLAFLRADLVETNRLKIFLHLLIPDYNLDLNLNLEVKTDEEKPFTKIAPVLGLFRVHT